MSEWSRWHPTYLQKDYATNQEFYMGRNDQRVLTTHPPDTLCAPSTDLFVLAMNLAF